MNQTIQRIGLLLLLGLAVLSLIVLTAGLPQLELTAAWRDFTPDVAETAAGNEAEAASGLNLGEVSGAVLQALGLSIFILAPILLVLMLLSAEMRRALLKDLRRVISAAAVIAVIYLLREEIQTILAGEWNLGVPTESTPNIPDFINQPAPLLVFFIAVTCLTLLVGAVWLAWRWLRPQNRLKLLALDAQDTVAELQAGADFQNTIINAYYRMCQLLADEKHIERAKGMTPGEFARRLENLGVAGAEAQRLTWLFEQVRYGGHGFDPAAEREAVACLTAVARAALAESERSDDS